MTKTYEGMEWGFLKAMFLALVFASDWLNLIILFIFMVRYNILINSFLVGQIVPSRGLRQGEPLSPDFFIVCAEDLSLLLQVEIGMGGRGNAWL